MHCDEDFSNYEFTFLNRTLSFQRDAMDWRPSETLRLWRYNLHYFDFLRDPSRPLPQKIGLIDDWIIHNPQGSEPAWEPYTVSLRIVNWCLFFWSLPKERIPVAWSRSLHLQARWLERNLELHILANHYFENIKAMIFASLFFDDRYSSHWFSHFEQELSAQLKEQTLADGGHYERSPQYHCILLEDYLDIYALLYRNTDIIELNTLTLLSKTIESGLRFLVAIATPDDDIPLFNDSASDTASRPSILIAKARQLGFAIDAIQSTLIDLPDSGLFGWKSGNDYFLIDCGDIGPAYQPGHTHCDFLSFVLMIDGNWIVVDSGVCEYEPGTMRSYVRSTAAHNTVTVDGYEQSEVWGEFRVGRRARRINASLRREGNTIVFEGAYAGFPASNANIIHRRRATLTVADSGKILAIEITDTVTGNNKNTHRIESLLHLHPSLKCRSDAAIVIQQDTKDILRITGLSVSKSVNSWYCPQFGVTVPNQQLHAIVDGILPATLSYQIAINS